MAGFGCHCLGLGKDKAGVGEAVFTLAEGEDLRVGENCDKLSFTQKARSDDMSW